MSIAMMASPSAGAGGATIGAVCCGGEACGADPDESVSHLADKAYALETANTTAPPNATTTTRRKSIVSE
jgi:hypothetical protein